MQWSGKENRQLVTMHRLRSATPFSSDEGAESGDDSEEDLVTNYMPGSIPPEVRHPHHQRPPPPLHRHQGVPPSPHYHQGAPPPPPPHHPHQGMLQRQLHHGHPDGVQPAHTHGPPRRLVRMAEIPTMDSVTAESLGMGSTTTIPTISITPHSPISQKPFTTLDDSFRHLQCMQEGLQKQLDGNANNKSGGRALTRLSSSCPSLNVEGEELEEEDPPSCKSGGSVSVGVHRGSLGGEDNSPSSTTPLTSGSLDDTHLCPDTPKIRVNDSTPTGSEEFLLDDRKIRAALGPSVLDQHRRRSWSGLSDEEKKRARQRSVSLSSLDSDTDDQYFDTAEENSNKVSDTLDGRSTKQRSLSGCASAAEYNARTGGSSTHSLNEEKKVKKSEKPRLLTPRLTLQKSISTPSILAGVINQQLAKQGPQSSDQYDDESVAAKPRKRGSIFFRKKKDKSKKTSHQFVPVCYSNSATCDVCSKPMTNKPALRCETCLVCVHEITCKDQISDCSKLKNPKVAQKSTSSVSLSNATKSSSLGSTPGASFSGGFPGSATRSRSVVHSSSPTRPYSISSSSGGMSSPVRRLSGFSQWKKVATKLGVNKVTSEEKEMFDSHGDATDANIMEVNSASMESLEDAQESTHDSSLDYIDSDPELRLLEAEPELWVKTVDKELLSKLTEKQIKKQEYVYELIMTEKNHCRTLKVIKKLFAEGMVKELGLKETFVESLFPCLDDLITIHFNFLWRLRERQRVNKYIETIGDLLLDQFSGDNAQSLKEAYGRICAKQPDSIANFKELQKTDRRFQNFIKNRSDHRLLEKKEVTGRWQFTSQRCTKYPLGMIEMIKYTRDNPQEKETLEKALGHIKEILRDINTQIHDKEMGQRLLEIYNKIDAKSSTMFREQKFKKSDLITDWRKLLFEGTATLIQQRGKPILVVVIVMTDLLFFLHENNQKYYFVAPDNKAEAIPLSKLIIREKASHDKVIYVIISGSEVDNHMYELEVIHPNSRKSWLDTIREAVDHCPTDDLAIKRLSDGSSDRVHELVMIMQHLDKELMKICEEKNKAVNEFASRMGGDTSSLQTPDYRAMLDQHNLDPESAKELEHTSIIEALRLIASSCGWATNLARSVSSVGEHQSETYVSPSLPKRAETFGGFDNPIKDDPKVSAGKKKRDSKVSLLSTGTGAEESLKGRRPSGTSLTVKISADNVSTASSNASDASNTPQQQTLAAHLTNCLNTALVLSQHHHTQSEMLRAKVSTGSTVEGRFSHSQKLEELRNIQEQISRERSQWTQERDNREKWIVDTRKELEKWQENLRSQQEDISQQREDLFRKLEALRNQGIYLNPTRSASQANVHNYQVVESSSVPSSETIVQNPISPTSAAPPSKTKGDALKHRTSTASLLKRDSSSSLLPTHNVSNLQKVPVKQQLPMKLAKLGAGSSSSTSSSSSSSMSSSLSLGGSMSPSQDQRPSHPTSPSSGVQQMLPLKLSEMSTVERGMRGGGYQRLSSPPAEGGTSHSRTGSSPATLQNGALSTSATSPGYATSGNTRVEGGRYPPKTNTYPKIPPRLPPKPPADKTAPPPPTSRIKNQDSSQEIFF